MARIFCRLPIARDRQILALRREPFGLAQGRQDKHYVEELTSTRGSLLRRTGTVVGEGLSGFFCLSTDRDDHPAFLQLNVSDRYGQGGRIDHFIQTESQRLQQEGWQIEPTQGDLLELDSDLLINHSNGAENLNSGPDWIRNECVYAYPVALNSHLGITEDRFRVFHG